MERIDWTRLASFLFCVLVGLGVLLLSWHYLLPVLLPFLVAFLLSFAVRRPARAVARHTRLPVGAVSVALLLLLVSAGCAGVYLLVLYLGREALALAERLLTDGTLAALLDRAEAWFSSILLRFGTDAGALPSLSSLLYEALGSIAASLPSLLSATVSSLPRLLFFGILVLVASFYFCLDGGATERVLRGLCPTAIRVRLSSLRARLGILLRRYLLAYLSLFALTLSLIFFGFLLLGIEHAFLLAALIALADLPPVIGVGTVLLPWGLFLILTGDGPGGIALLFLYLVVSVVRQLAEPRLLGRSLGLHPLLTLLVSYAGLCLFGFWGLLLSPFAALLCKALFSVKKQGGSL